MKMKDSLLIRITAVKRFWREKLAGSSQVSIEGSQQRPIWNCRSRFAY